MDILMPMGTFDALALTRRACSRGGSADSNIQIGNLHIREFSSFPSYLHHVHRSLRTLNIDRGQLYYGETGRRSLQKHGR